MPKCTAEHVPIALKTKDGKSYTAFVKKDHAKELGKAKGIIAEGVNYCQDDICVGSL